MTMRGVSAATAIKEASKNEKDNYNIGKGKSIKKNNDKEQIKI